MDWIFLDVCYASCSCTFLCSFIMSQASITMAMTTFSLTMMVSPGLSSLSLVTVAPSFMGLPVTVGQCDMVLPPPLIPRCSGGIIGLATMSLHQPPSLMPLQAYANYAMGSSQVGFFFQVSFCVLYVWCPFLCLFSTFKCHIHLWRLNFWGLYCCNTLEFTCDKHVQPVDGHQPTPSMHRVAVPSTTLSRGSLLLLNQLFPSHPIYMLGYTVWGLAESHLITLPSLLGGEKSSFPAFVPSDDMVDSESAMDVKPSGSGVVIGCQVDEFTHTWSAEWFVAHSHICPGFTGKVSALTPLSPGTRVWK